MLKVHVGLSRKLTRDFNSQGFSINLEGEIGVDRTDTEGVVERIQELYDLSEEALLRQIERYESESAIASHDESPAEVGESAQQAVLPATAPGNGAPRNRISGGEPATNKQIQFLLTLAKRLKLSKPKLEKRIEQILGETIDVYELTKRDAGVILDSLTEKPAAKSNGR